MTKQVLLATNNAKKLIELQRIIAKCQLEVEVLSLADVEPYLEPAETAWTFEGNALIKARAGLAATGLPTVADDSGLSVDALGGMPGVRSARWAGSCHDDAANLDLLLRQIDDVPAKLRTAKFVSVVALVMPEGNEFTFRGEMPGWLTTAPRGTNGFGYDPIFVADASPLLNGGQPRTNAELSAKEKDAISHRGIALRAMLPVLSKYLAL